VPSHLLVYVGVVVAIALLPGPDTAVVTKNALMHGREAALGSAIGVNVGLSVWTLATALGVAAILRSSATVYDALKLVGALYLIWIGARAIWDSRTRPRGRERRGRARPLDRRPRRLRAGPDQQPRQPEGRDLLHQLAPQFVSPHSSALLQMLMLGGIFIAFNVFWMCSYALAAVRLAHVLSRPRVKAVVDRVSGLVLVGVGIRLAIER